MKKFLLSLIVTVFTVGVAMPDAEARRLGGGGSFGIQRQATPAPRAPATAQTPPRTQQAGAAPNAAKPRSSWMGPIAGLAAGLGLAALFSHLGLGEEFGSLVLMLLLVGGAFLLFRMLTRRPADSARLQYAGAGRTDPQAAPAAQFEAVRTPAGESSALPADFDAAAFAREAKVQFIRLQAAHDEGNLDDIRAFTTPEVFAEVRMQITERGGAVQRTDVVELDAQVVEVAQEAGQYIVGVRFSGLLREEADAAPQPFDEIWHLTKPVDGSRGWVIAGIQQVS
ncbi:Tim44 domain-containing protein [Pseudothauera rhizosphaerae]|uniref:Tim44 domain-containing protein n=1 Tax=Pseudothauera rhizosphaerae TaxID=2565932 RepID=A0A4S4AL06_9RHOO|nr:TIM44-like domain-containing protein [Pseudothauera rhizosphaerae]THF60164.1 Tim44 domain-containing protein [Pseudothauera rhizosphaerae]